MSLSKDSHGPVTLMEAVIFLQFGISFFITVLTIVGISFGYTVSSYFLMALLQVLVAIPGIVHIALQGTVWVAMYVAFQSVTSVCEIYWLFVMIVDNQSAGRWIGLLFLTLINVSAVVIAMWFRQKTINLPMGKNKMADNKDKKMQKPNMKAPSHSMSDVERSKIRSSKTTPPSSPPSSSKKSSSTKREFSEMSSKGSLKVRKNKKTISMESNDYSEATTAKTGTEVSPVN